MQADHLVLDQVLNSQSIDSQLLPTREVLQEEFFSGAKDGDDPAEHTSKTHRCAVQVIDSADVRSFGETQEYGRSLATAAFP